MITIQEKIDLLSEPVWSFQDIMSYLNVSKTTAIKIKNRAIKEKEGAVQYGSNLVKVDSVLSLFGTSRKEEYERFFKETILQDSNK